MKDRPLITPGTVPEETKLDKAMLPEMGDSCVGLLSQMGVGNPGIVIAVIDGDTGEMAMTTNMADDGAFVLLQELLDNRDSATHVEREAEKLQ